MFEWIVVKDGLKGVLASVVAMRELKEGFFARIQASGHAFGSRS